MYSTYHLCPESYKYMYEKLFLLGKNLQQVKCGIGFMKGYFFPGFFISLTVGDILF